MTERTAEFIIGILGGIIGILAVPGLLLLGVVVAGLGGTLGVFGAAIVGGILSVFGLIGAAFVKSRSKISGAIMLVCGILGLFVALGLWIGALLLIVAGIISLIRKEKTSLPPPPMSPEVAYCTTCGKKMSFIGDYKRWYCESCQKYV